MPPTYASGWFNDAEFVATAENFANRDWVPMTINAYRSRFLADQERDRRYEYLLLELAEMRKPRGQRSWCTEAAIRGRTPRRGEPAARRSGRCRGGRW
jgi:hypothetical protein